MKIKIHKLYCLRCGYAWYPRTDKKPLVCPCCKSRIWWKSKNCGYNKGEHNPNWKGGKHPYKNQRVLRRNRAAVLKNANFICHYCGGIADRVHHLDHSTDNHMISNLVATCHKCHMLNHPPTTSKYQRIYGYKITELSQILGIKDRMVIYYHGKGRLAEMIETAKTTKEKK